jgi:plastocyanin
LPLSRFAPLALALLSALAITCGGNNKGSGSSATRSGQGGADSSGTQLSIEAKSNTFDKKQLTAPAHTEVSVEVDNLDAGVLHNFSVYRGRDAREAIHVGQLFPGIAKQPEKFTTPDPGSYFFRCDVHPDTMTGTFVVQ